jgi:hypothetical protein
MTGLKCCRLILRVPGQIVAWNHFHCIATWDCEDEMLAVIQIGGDKRLRRLIGNAKILKSVGCSSIKNKPWQIVP